MTSKQGFVFVHGINQTPAELDGMQERIEGLLHRNGLQDRFSDATGKRVWVAKWRSLGTFIGDLEDLSVFRVRRCAAVMDIAHVIQHAWATLQDGIDETNTKPEDQPRLLVCAHSMGQPLGLAALSDLEVGRALEKQYGFPVRTSFLSVGGPLGNNDPVAKEYFDLWGSLIPKEKPDAIHEWIDVWNPLDPICHGPLMGSWAYKGSQHVVFKTPGQPNFPSPFVNNIAKYHSAYFDHPDIFNIAAKMLDNMLVPEGSK